jgi:hypothetical protein
VKTIDTEALLAELQKCGTDERDIRPVMILARHINSVLEDMRCEVEDVADERIQRARDRDNYWRSYDY